MYILSRNSCMTTNNSMKLRWRHFRCYVSMGPYQSDFSPPPIQCLSDLSLRQRSPRLVVNDVRHEPRKGRLFHMLHQDVNAKIWKGWKTMLRKAIHMQKREVREPFSQNANIPGCVWTLLVLRTKVMIAKAGSVDSQLVQDWNHLLSFGEGAHWKKN